MCEEFLACDIIIGTKGLCRHHEIAQIMINTDSIPFREVWRRFCRLADLSEDFIARGEILMKDENTEEVIIKILENWSSKQVVTLGQLTNVLRQVPLVSTANQIEKHFNSLLVRKLSDVDTNEFSSRKSSLEQTPRTSITPLLKKIDDGFGEAVYRVEEDNKRRHNHKRKFTCCLNSNYCIACLTGAILGGLGLALLTLLLIHKPDILKCTLNMCISDTVRSSPCKDISLNISVKTQNEYERAISKFDKRECISVNITSLNPTDWSEKYHLSYSKYIGVLTILNVTSVNTLFNILSQTSYLGQLEIDGSSNSSCKSSEIRSLFTTKISYSFLSSLKISNFRSCAQIYILLSRVFSCQQLKTLIIDNSIIDNTNIDLVRSIIYNAANTLSTVKLAGEIRSNSSLFSYSKPLLQVQSIQLDVKQRKVLLVPIFGHEIAGKDFCRVFVNIHTFENTVGIDFIDFINVLKCTKLQYITARVIIHVNDPFLNINAAFKGDDLENVTLSLQFDYPCPSCEKTRLLGIEDFKKRIRKKHTISFLNCACNDDKGGTGSSERDSFVIDHEEIK